MTPYGEAVLRNCCERVAQAPTGLRNIALNKEAFAVSGYAAGGEIDAELARPALLDAARVSGLPDREATATFRSAWRAGGTMAKRAGDLFVAPAPQAQGEGVAYPSPTAVARVLEQTRPPTDDDLDAFRLHERVRQFRLVRICDDQFQAAGSPSEGGCVLPAYDMHGRQRSWMFWNPGCGHEPMAGRSQGLSLANTAGLAFLVEGQRPAAFADAPIEIVVSRSVETFIEASAQLLDESPIRGVFMPGGGLDFLARLPSDRLVSFEERP